MQKSPHFFFPVSQVAVPVQVLPTGQQPLDWQM
jgi:hypothetical protein